MGRPQKSQVFKANVNALGNIAQPLRDAAKTLASSGERVHTTVQEFDWEGAARESAVARSDRELTQNRIVAADLDALADAYENGKKTMGPMIDGLKSKARGLEGNHFEVSENWDVKDTYDYAAARKLATMMDPADTAGLQEQITQLQNRRANEAATEGGNLGRLADELGVADTNTATAISNAVAALGGANGPKLAPPPLAPGQVANRGAVAGTDNPGAIPGIRAADLGEVIQLPNGKYVAIFGDSYANPGVGGEGNPHYSSVAVPVTFDEQGRPHFGSPLNGTTLNPGLPNEVQGSSPLFPLPQAAIKAGANNTLPAGSITTRDGRTYMMVVGTNTTAADPLKPVGSWLVEVNNNPAGGWRAVETDGHGHPLDTYRSTGSSSAPTQISGFQGSDGNVYIAADNFDRNSGVSVYRVDPEHIADRGAWQPYNPANNSWGTAGQPATATITPPNQKWGEISFREIDGKAVLAGANFRNGQPENFTVEVHVGDSPTSVVRSSPIVVMSNAPGSPNNVPAPYGGYILPGSTLNNVGIFGSQWWGPKDALGNPLPVHYDVQDIRVNTPEQR
ncbi:MULTISPECIES: DUF4185 domain-containing protein [Mycobacterium]|uniref:DUF4185 domain-containing protein n=1 Tax=Mycobacterium kiyosense TaxID=2871094 RepID=A0A9P3Q5H9_9MYCO|nr:MULTISPECIES: DUF4185 domain-containing protein [Mycobacterium]BDE16701.1 hypothetical protein MKCMC460_55610 [Mycobacterium sp. 20KCMC460]GLB83967.1 hypothetical protein SRL2020028_32230 [Mycobacterium kiyosense]GLB90458.1 hypothetical protein SRL2020130_32750 [Mycobacterium kiyosense]GLB96327.1 hypothetical protein SRL2020226_31030 [Mycobacterium kiyosense]GLC03000.1 hypothetical protein SRL2020400_35910 [Mycobacterium kiyosense]